MDGIFFLWSLLCIIPVLQSLVLFWISFFDYWLFTHCSVALFTS